MTYACQCPCATTRFKIHGEPVTRFYCHCTICQTQYQSPFVDVTLYKLNEVELPEDHGINFAKLKRYFAVERGFCPNCRKPVMAKVGEGDKAYAFVSVRNYLDPSELPEPEMHVYYGTRVEDVEDDLPKYGNFFTSMWAFIRRMKN